MLYLKITPLPIKGDTWYWIDYVSAKKILERCFYG